MARISEIQSHPILAKTAVSGSTPASSTAVGTHPKVLSIGDGSTAPEVGTVIHFRMQYGNSSIDNNLTINGKTYSRDDDTPTSYVSPNNFVSIVITSSSTFQFLGMMGSNSGNSYADLSGKTESNSSYFTNLDRYMIIPFNIACTSSGGVTLAKGGTTSGNNYCAGTRTYGSTRSYSVTAGSGSCNETDPKCRQYGWYPLGIIGWDVPQRGLVVTRLYISNITYVADSFYSQFSFHWMVYNANTTTTTSTVSGSSRVTVGILFTKI